MEGEYVLGSKILVRYLGKEKGNTIGKNLGMFVDKILSPNITYTSYSIAKLIITHYIFFRKYYNTKSDSQ